MKKVFIPAGEVVSYNLLHTDRIVVKGVLRVNGKLVAKEIVGGGIIEAREIICDDMRASSATADFITARRIATDKLFVAFECRASEQIAVRDYLEAGYISTGNLTVSLSRVASFDADKVIMVNPKRSLLGLLWASWWRGLLLDLFHGCKTDDIKQKNEAVDAPKSQDIAVETVDTVQPHVAMATVPDGNAVDLMITALQHLKEQGYTISKLETAHSSTDKKADAA